MEQQSDIQQAQILGQVLSTRARAGIDSENHQFSDRPYFAMVKVLSTEEGDAPGHGIAVVGMDRESDLVRFKAYRMRIGRKAAWPNPSLWVLMGSAAEIADPLAETLRRQRAAGRS